MVFGVILLPVHGVNNAFEDVLFGDVGFEVFDEIESLIDLIIFEVVDDEVELGLWEDLHHLGKGLNSILSVSEHHKVVS